MPKKGQVTIFLLLIAVFVIGFLVVSYTDKKAAIEKPIDFSLDEAILRSFIDGCIKQTSEQAIEYVARRGGYMVLPSLSTSGHTKETAYYLHEGMNTMPSLGDVEKHVSDYVDENLPSCLEDFKELSNQGFEISSAEPQTETIIRPDSIHFTVSYPITAKKKEKTYDMGEFSYGIKSVRIGEMHEALSVFIHDQEGKTDLFCLSCLLEMAQKNNVTAYIDTLEPSSFLITIEDNQSIVDNRPLDFIFALKLKEYTCINPPPDDPDFVTECVRAQIEASGYELKVENPGKLKVRANETLEYTIKAFGLDVEFQSLSIHFDIDPILGRIVFAPTADEIVAHPVEIMVVDKFGNSEIIKFSVEVTP